MASRAGFRPDLEGLRGVAILLVVLFHAGVPALAGGFVGVDVFFVLSGFFITQVLLREYEADGRLDLNAFYGRRALRVVPSLLLVLLATLAAVMWLYAPIDRAAIAKTAQAVALGSGNIAFASGAVNYFNSGENPLLHTWSLAVEEQFYFVWPLLLLLIGYISKRSTRSLTIGFLVAGVASFVACVLVTKTAQPWAFFGTPTRLWEFAFGGLCFIWLREHPTRTRNEATLLQVGGLIAIGIAVVMYDSATPYPGVAALLPAFGAVLLLLAGCRAEPDVVTRLLSIAPLQWLGKVSFAWYLWHWPIVGVGVVLDPTITPFGKLLWSLAALVLAWLTYRYIEGSARTGRLARIDRAWLAPTALAASIVAALIAHGAMLAAARQASSAEQRSFAQARGDHIKHDCWGTTIDEWTGPCEFGDRSATTIVALLGDSHAEHWLGALDRIGRERHWKIIALVKGGCPVTEMPELTDTSREQHYRECARYRGAMVQRIIRMKPSAVVLSSWDHYVPMKGSLSMWQVTPDLWEKGLRRTYQRMTSARIPTIAIRGTPRTWFDVPACLSRKAARLPLASQCEYNRTDAISTVARNAQTNAARGLTVAFVDMNDVICPTQRCSVIRNGTIVFTDDNHLTATFSRSVAPELAARMDAALAPIGARLP